MELRILHLCIVSLLSVALSYGRTLIGRHVHACKPMNGLVRVKLPNCRESTISLDQCIGTCISWDGLPENVNKPAKTCTCCKPVTFRDKEVLVECIDRYGRHKIEQHIIKEPKACTCLPCNRRRKRSQVMERLLPRGNKGTQFK